MIHHTDTAPPRRAVSHLANPIANISQAAVTMASLELVEFINEFRREQATQAGQPFPSKGYAELQHADFMKKVPEVLGERAGNFSATYQIPGPNGSSRTAPRYVLPKREACLMAMSYSYDLQARVFDRMTALEELERGVHQPTIPQTMGEALRLAAELADRNAVQAALLNEQAPKAAFHDQVVQSEQTHTLGEAAKLLGTGRTRLCRWMRQNAWINRRHEPYQDKIEAGLLDMKYSKAWKHPERGETRSITPLVTGKGLVKLQTIFAGHNADLFATAQIGRRTPARATRA